MAQQPQKRLPALLAGALFITLFFTQTALAVPPPDFIFNIGSSLIQVFGVAILFASAAFSITFNYLKTKWALIRNHRPSFIAFSVILALLVSGGVALGYGQIKQNLEYNKWLKESEQYAQLDQERPLPKVKPADNSLNLLALGSTPNQIPTAENPFISNIDPSLKDEPLAQFAEDYYGAIARGDLDYAYSISKKSTSLSTFKYWYIDTTGITLDKLTIIDDRTCSLELTLYEGDKYTRYGTLMTVAFENEEPVRVASSLVRILSEGTVSEMNGTVTATNTVAINPYFQQNSDVPLSITNEDFDAILNSGRSDYIVLDARENLEYNNGHFPGALHIRYADLQAGKWIELPEDKTVFVFCWSGIRGQEVAEFLRTKNIVAVYLKGGASDWVAYGGAWEGNINFSQQYSEDRYKVIYSTNQVRNYVKDGVVLVDTREPWVYDSYHIEGSVNIPTMYIPSVDYEDAFNQVPPGSTVITVCDEYVNCFDAKITGVELESRGYTFIGRYNKPWEY
ncbi:hypothetical protein KKC94_00970 [Patescibacteria group bacterium]|nr:hypothetical protein [Patescibacteria group bacterium]